MSRNNGRTAPFPGFSRAIPIVGEPLPAGPPAGLYYYYIPTFVQWPTRAPQAKAFYAYYPRPIEGGQLPQMAAEMAAQVKAEEIKRLEGLAKDTGLAVDDPGDPEIVLLSPPMLLSFTPQEQLERQAAEAEKKVEIVQ